VTSDRRKFPRTGLRLPVEVQAYSCENGSFVESTETSNVSPLGASFALQQTVEIDDILRLTLPMPARFRLFDLELPQYQIYCQVRRTRHWPDGRLIVGVAFISKEPPDLEPSQATFEHPAPFENDKTRTDSSEKTTSSQPIKPPIKMSPPRAESGSPLKHPTIAQKLPVGEARIEPRAKLRFNLSIRGHDKHGNYFIETIQTEDVSRHGLCFFISRRELDANTIIELIGFQGKFTAQGEVRHISYLEQFRSYRIGVRLLGEPSNWIVK
jgi:hypothetical protein